MARAIVFASSTLVAATLVAAFAPEETAQAFPTLDKWHMAASGPAGVNRAGAEGLYGTGGPSDLGIQCVHCHTDPPGNTDLGIAVNPPFQTSGNDELYVPGQKYDFTLTQLGGDLINPNVVNSGNGFAMSFEDPGGQALGVITTDTPGNSSASCPPNAPSTLPAGSTYVYGDCHAVLYVNRPNVTTWSFSWQAPNTGSGDVTVWWGLVDGDTQAESSLKDDTKQGSFVLFEGS